MGIYFVKRLSVDEFYKKIIDNLEVSDENYINELMKTEEGDDVNIIIDRVDCSLYDPYTWKIINLPVRGKFCRHAQCFDLKTHLTFMEIVKNRNWRCPICQRDARNFVMDRQILHLIKKISSCSNIPNKITFLEDGRVLLKITNENDNNHTI